MNPDLSNKIAKFMNVQMLPTNPHAFKLGQHNSMN